MHQQNRESPAPSEDSSSGSANGFAESEYVQYQYPVSYFCHLFSAFVNLQSGMHQQKRESFALSKISPSGSANGFSKLEYVQYQYPVGYLCHLFSAFVDLRSRMHQQNRESPSEDSPSGSANDFAKSEYVQYVQLSDLCQCQSRMRKLNQIKFLMDALLRFGI